jgi:hypothetical protein
VPTPKVWTRFSKTTSPEKYRCINSIVARRQDTGKISPSPRNYGMDGWRRVPTHITSLRNCGRRLQIPTPDWRQYPTSTGRLAGGDEENTGARKEYYKGSTPTAVILRRPHPAAGWTGRWTCASSGGGTWGPPESPKRRPELNNYWVPKKTPELVYVKLNSFELSLVWFSKSYIIVPVHVI